MAKVDSLTLKIEGKEYTYNINVGKSGIFKVKLDWDVAKLIGLKSNQLEFQKLNDLKSHILSPYNEYLESKTETTLWIMIGFHVKGELANDHETGDTFCYSADPFYKSGWSHEYDSIGFEFDVCMKETRSTGVETWYDAKFDGELKEWQKDGSLHGMGSKILIPYSEEAYQTLLKARKGLQKISKMLYGVLSQEPQDLIRSLEAGGLLALPETYNPEKP